MNRFYRLFALGLTICSILMGCASQKPIATTAEMSSVARSSLSEAIYLRALSISCEKLGGDTADTAFEVYHSWLERNWQWVAISDLHYSDQLKSQTITYQQHDVALPALKFLAEQEAGAYRKIGLNSRSRTSGTKTCKKKMAPYLLSKKDLIFDPSKKIALETMLQIFGQQPPNVHRVPRLAGNLNPHGKPGRMLYKVERSLKEQGCAKPQLLTLNNQWPLEAYGAFCSNQKQMFISCEWGKCSFQ